MTARYYCSNLTDNKVTLSQAESHHAIHVMRVSEGDTIILFDGHGTTAEGQIRNITRRDVSVEVVSRQTHTRPTGELHILAAPPKGDRLRWMIEKLTELGVTAFRPLTTARSVRQGANRSNEKLNAAVIEAAKQCGRNWLMAVGEPMTLDEACSMAAESDHRILVAHPSGDSFSPSGSQQKTTMLIGPEGGFSEDEINLLRQVGVVIVSWPGHILRTETAAITFAALALSEATP